jgi:subfamily B ATP-binding cassette protein MsbA
MVYSLQSKTTIALYLRLLKYVRPYLWALMIAMLANIIYSGVDAGFVYLMKPILNKGFIVKDFQFIRWLPVLVLAAFVIRGLANCVSNYFMAVVSRSVVMRFRQDIFTHLLHLPANYYDNTSSGQILSTIIYDVEQVANAGADALTDFIRSGFFIVGLLIVMFSISWQLSLLYFITVPVIAMAVRYSTQRLRRINLKIQEQMGKVTAIAEEAIEGYKVVRSFGNERYETDKFEQATRYNRRQELKVVVTKFLSVSSIETIAGLVLALIIYLATLYSSSTMLSAGSFASIVTAMLALLKPLKTFTTVNATIQRGLAGAQSIFSLLDREPEKDTGTMHVNRMRGKIELNNVSFIYHDTNKVVLDQVNLTILPGQTVALIGHSGGGKTTIISLLQRFYDNFTGTITIDDIDIRDIVLTDLRRQFSMVSQHVVLFNDTIARNIAYGKFEAVSETEIIAAAKAANAWDFITELPEGLNTVVGDNGMLLSGGQRQRIAIARAILKDAPILILDEATSALDTVSERKIQEAIEELMRNRTTLVIAHRLSTVEHADLIVVLEEGRTVEVGTHQALLERGKQYAKLYNMQFKA